MKRSAGIIIVYFQKSGKNSEWRYLLLRSFKIWDFPKGEVEKSETPILAAIREVEEETGLKDLKFTWGHHYKETAPYRIPHAIKIARYYLAESDHKKVTLPISPELGHPEHQEYRWLSFHEAIKLLPKRLVPILKWANQSVESSLQKTC